MNRQLVNILLALAMAGQAHAGEIVHSNIGTKLAQQNTTPAPRILTEQQINRRLGELYLLCPDFKLDYYKRIYPNLAIIGNKSYGVPTVTPSEIHLR